MTNPIRGLRYFPIGAAMIAVAILSAAIARPAVASERDGSVEVEAIQKVASGVGSRFDQATVGEITVHPESGIAVSDTFLRIPTQPSEDVTLVTETGQSVVIGLPRDGDSEGSDAIVAPDGSVVFRDVSDETDLVIQVQEGGGVRMITVIRGEDAPHAFEFPIRQVIGQSLFLTGDGGAVVTDGEAVLIEVPPPWAFDSDGLPVEANYTVDGNTLVLNISHDDQSAYPIIADPWWKRALIGASFGFFGVAVCLPFGPVGAALCSIVFSTTSSTLSYR